MPPNADQPELTQLLLETVESLEELEILSLVHGPERRFDLGLITSHIRLPEDAIEAAVSRLVARGALSLLDPQGHEFNYAPNPELRDRIARVVSEYKSNPLVVMKLMTEISIERVRTDALRTFAECFRIRGPR